MDLLSAIILNIHHTLDNLQESIDEINDIKTRIVEIGEIVHRSTGVLNAALRSRIHKPLVKSIASKPSIRGSSCSVIVFLTPYNAAINIDIIDAYRKLGGLEELDSVSVSRLIDNDSNCGLRDNETKSLLIYGLHTNIPIMRSTGILSVRNDVKLAASSDSYNIRIATPKKPVSLVVNGQPVIRSQSIFEGLPYCTCPYYPDWRFNPVKIYESDDSYGIIGANALVYDWVRRREI